MLLWDNRPNLAAGGYLQVEDSKLEDLMPNCTVIMNSYG